MAMWLKQSTSVDVPIGPFVDATDGVTAETALTITQPDIRLKKNGGAWAQKAAAQTLIHEENGWYEVTLDATDTDTLGHLVVAVHESGALPVWREFMVVPANEYDSLVSGTDALDVEVASIAAGAITAAAIAADAITAAKVAADVTTELQSGLATGADLAVVAGYLDTEIAAIKAKTDNLPADPASQAAVLAKLPAALVSGRIDANLSAIGDDTTALTAFKRAVLGNVIGTVDGTGASTTSIPTSSLTPAGTAADQFKGRILTFDKDTTTAALRGQATDITASSAAATPTFTVTALTTIPATGDTFTIT